MPIGSDTTEPMSGISIGAAGCLAGEDVLRALGVAVADPRLRLGHAAHDGQLVGVLARSSRSSSVNRMPGTSGVDGLEGLRCSAGASGLGSQVSICETPPCSKITRTFFAAAVLPGRDRRPPAWKRYETGRSKSQKATA